ncbi:MAG: hypothetical protein ABR920_08110 [Terriglobales bacterium]
MLRKLAFRPDWQIAMAITVALRVVFSAIAAVFSFFLRPDATVIRSNALTESLPASGTVHNALLGVWERFDTLWYLHIAQHGYDQPMAVIFYPLYPALIRVVSGAAPATAAALVVSTAAAFFSFWGLLRLAEPERTARGRMGTLLVVAAWPSSFVLFAGYAESLTLALIVWAVICAREGRWGPATLCGILAGLSRPSGVLVAVPLFVLAWRSRRARALMVVLSPTGLLGYWGWLRWSGRLSVVEAYRVYQGATLAPPWASLAEAIRLIVGHGDGLLAIKFVLVALATAFSLRREVRLEDKLFALAMTVQMLMYTGRPLLGGPRYVLPMYPAFLALGGYAAGRWSGKQFAFYLGCFGFLNLAWMRAFLDWSLVF